MGGRRTEVETLRRRRPTRMAARVMGRRTHVCRAGSSGMLRASAMAVREIVGECRGGGGGWCAVAALQGGRAGAASRTSG